MLFDIIYLIGPKSCRFRAPMDGADELTDELYRGMHPDD